MRGLPAWIVGVVGLVVGFIVGIFAGRMTVKREATAPEGKMVGTIPKRTVAPKKAPPVLTAPVVAGMQYEGMEFDTAADFKNPGTDFTSPKKIFFRIKFSDQRVAKNGRKPSVGISYRRIGKTPDLNGPVRQLGGDDIKPSGKAGEVVAWRPGLTFMAQPKPGATTFEVYVNLQPVGRASFTVAGAPAPVGKGGA